MNRDSYNKIAKEWMSVRNQSFISNLIEGFANKIKTNGNVLDIGCGFGYLTKYLCKRGFSVTGVDISEKMIEIANSKKINNAEFVECDFLDFITTTKYDGVIAWDSLFHFPKERQKDIYAKVSSLLNNNGYFLFTHGDADDEHLDKMMGEFFYYSCLPMDKVSQILIDNDFKTEYVYKDFLENDSHRSLVVLAQKINYLRQQNAKVI